MYRRSASSELHRAILATKTGCQWHCLSIKDKCLSWPAFPYSLLYIHYSWISPSFQISQLIRDWEVMSNRTDGFCSRLEDCSHNFHTLSKHTLDVDVRVKVEKQRKDTREQAHQFQLNVTMFLTHVNKSIFGIPQRISDFVEIVHQSLRNLRTHFRKELPHFLVLSETCFTSLKEDLEQFSA